MEASQVSGTISSQQVASAGQHRESDQVQKEKGSQLDQHLKEEKKEFTKQELKNGLENLNDTVQTFHKDLRFELHEESEMMMAKLMNLEENEVIKEMPPKEILDMLGRIEKAIGLIIDEKI